MRIRKVHAAATIWAFAVFSLANTATVLAVQPEANTCDHGIYRGLDSRLHAHVLGKVPPGPIVGFEIVNNRPAIALPHSLLTFDKKTLLELPIPQTVKSISVGGGHDLLVQTDTGIEKIGDRTFVADDQLTRAIRGRIYGSGRLVFLEVRTHQDLVQFVARRHDGKSFIIATMKGPFRAASWNQYGLAAVVDDNLIIWAAGSKNIVRLVSDSGLNNSRDVALVGPARAVVTLRNMVVLVTSETMTVVAPAASARCRFAAGVLYLLDTGDGIVWAIDGLDRLGSKAGDRTYARTLIRNLRQDADEKSTPFREAARILGCDTALQELGKAMSDNGLTGAAK